MMLSFDEEIIRRVQQGNRSEYLDIFERYYPRIEGYARRRNELEMAQSL